MSGIIFPNGLPFKDRYGNDIYTDFRNMLRLEILFDENIDDGFKIYFAVKLLYGNELPGQLNYTQALRELMWFYRCGKEEKNYKEGNVNKSVRIYDFEQDSDYIYAAFLSTYGIDLCDEDTHLHWWKFMAMFMSLPEDTQMSKRMYYRNIDTSKMKGSQKKEYERLKKAVALSKKQNISLKTMTARELEQKTRKRIVQRFEQAKEQTEKRV